jgi:hypothetical protein
VKSAVGSTSLGERQGKRVIAAGKELGKEILDNEVED